MDGDERWQRSYWRPGGGDPYLFFVVYGVTTPPVEIEGARYKTRGLPEGLEARAFTRAEHGEYLGGFEEGYAWDTLLEEDSKLADRVLGAAGAVVFAGEVPDPSSLDYLRDIIGIVASALDFGGVAVHDLFTMRWYTPAAWRAELFEPDEPDPQKHVEIFSSPEEDLEDALWIHTRGLIKFGRPDVSIHDVASADLEEVGGMVAELIDYQARGGVLGEGQPIQHPKLGRFIAHHAGDPDDPDFNNVHVALTRAL